MTRATFLALMALLATTAGPGRAGAQGEPERITAFSRQRVPLRMERNAPPVYRDRAELPVPMAVTGGDADFVQFVDPASRQRWLVSRFDVTLSGASRAQVSRPAGPCIQGGAMGMGRSC